MHNAYKNARLAPTDLGSGRVLAPGEAVSAGDLTLGVDEETGRPTHDQRLLDGGALIEAALPKTEPAGDADAGQGGEPQGQGRRARGPKPNDGGDS